MRFRFCVGLWAAGAACYATSCVTPDIQPHPAPTGPGLANGTVGQTYLQTLSANGVSGEVQWAGTVMISSEGSPITSPINLPPGLNSSATGNMLTIGGIPTQAGTFPVTISAIAFEESAVCPATANYVIAISGAAAALTITTATLPTATVGVNYKQMIAVTGGTPPYNFSASINGTPITIRRERKSEFHAERAWDGDAGGDGGGQEWANGVENLSDHGESGGNTAHDLARHADERTGGHGLFADLDDGGRHGAAYSYTVASGKLPDGLTLAGSTGLISGTPTATGSFTFTIQSTDANHATATATYTITIAAASQGLTITTQNLPSGALGIPYSATVTATGGTPPLQWTALGLPQGLSITPGNGANTITISGTPTAAAQGAVVTISVTDATNTTTSKTFPVTITAPLTITTTSLPSGTVGAPYTVTLTAIGGIPPYRWLVSGLPNGLSFTANADGTATITGTPTTAVQNQTVGIIVLDARNTGANQSLQITITVSQTIDSDPPDLFTVSTCKCKEPTPASSLRSPTTSSNSISEGNLMEQAAISKIGSTISLNAMYNTFNADGSRAMLDTVMGYGWTHSYNIFVFAQAGVTFRYDGSGRVTRYNVVPGVGYVSAPGYFETLTQSNGVITITQKDQTSYAFAQITGTPFQVSGTVYRLTAIKDRNGNVTTLSYTNGNLTGITDTYGRTLTLSYTTQNKLASVTDPLGQVTTFQYDSTEHSLTGITDAAGKATQYRYNSDQQLTGKTDRAVRSFTYAYTSGSPGLPVSVSDSANTARSTLSSSSNWGLDTNQTTQLLQRTYLPATTTNADGRGNQWKYGSDGNGFVTQAIAPDGATTKYTYDAATLQVASMTDANGNTTAYAYDAIGNRTKTTDALGHVTSYTYEPVFSMLTSMADARGRVTQYSYDSHGNRILKTDALGQTHKWTYDSHGNLLTETDENGHTASNQYDAFGNPIKLIDPTGAITTATYDALGNMLSRTDANGHTTSYQYDNLNRPTKATDATGHTDQTFYDGEGNRIQLVDRNGHNTYYQYDQRQRMVEATDGLGQSQAYGYDGDDNRTSLTDRNGHVTTYAYDAQNRPFTVTDALGNVATKIYDPAGNVIGETDANGNTTAYGYDALNRRTGMTDALGGLTQYFYDGGVFTGPVTVGNATVDCEQCGATPGSKSVTTQIDADGTAGVLAGLTRFEYDALGRRVMAVRKTGCVAGTDGTGCPDTITPSDGVTVYGYDPAGNRVTVTEPNGNFTTSAYDADNRVIRQINAAGDVTQQSYDGVGNVTAVTAPTLNVTTCTYDSLNRLIQATDSAGQVAGYSYDAAGNRTGFTDGNGNTSMSVYDVVNRLVMTTDPAGNSANYQYDPEGNLLEATDRNGNSNSYGYDAINRLVSTTDALGNVSQTQYDAVGNLTVQTDANGHQTQYIYDALNRLGSEMTADGLARSYAYDGVGNLISRTDQIGQTTMYSYNDLYFLTGRAYPSGVSDSFRYDLSGRVLWGQRGDWAETFTYDGANRITQTTQNGETIQYSYDIPGRTQTLMYPGGRRITEHMDARSRLDHIDDASTIAQYAYDAGNRVTNRSYRNGTSAAYAYNVNNWTTSLQHMRGTAAVAGFGYG